MSRFRSSLDLAARVPSELHNQKGHKEHRLARVIEIERLFLVDLHREPVRGKPDGVLSRPPARSRPGARGRNSGEFEEKALGVGLLER